MRHRWTDERRTYGSHRATCERCGLVRDRRFCYGRHWTEYDRDGVTVASTASGQQTPACVPAPTPPGAGRAPEGGEETWTS